MKKSILIAFVIFACTIYSYPQWVQSSGPEGKSITNIVNYNGTILIRSAMKSTDNGDSWQSASLTGIPSDYTGGATFYTAGGNLLAYAGDSIYKSTDNGDTWFSTSQQIDLHYNNAPAMTYFNNTLYLASTNTGVFKSTDDGDNWTEIGASTLSGEFPWVAGAAGNNIIVGTTSGIYVSENDDDDFSEVQGFDFGDNAIDIAVADGNVYLVTNHEKLYVSTDNGLNWSEKNMNTPVYDLVVNNANEVFASTGNGIYKIQNNGDSLVQMMDNGFEDLNVKELAIYNDIYVAATNMGVCRSVNASGWGLANHGLGYANVWGFDNTDSIYYMATSSGVWRSKSYGQRWIPVGLLGRFIRSVLVVGNKVYAAEAKYHPSSIVVHVSEDEGQSWTRVGSAIDNAVIPTLDTAGGHLYCHAEQGSNDGVYKLTNFQGDWTNENPSEGVAFNVIGNKIYNGLKVGDENASGWASLTGNISNVSPYCFTGGPDGTTIYAGAFIKVGGRPYAFKSIDGTDFSTFQDGMNSNTSTVFGMITRGDTIYAVAEEDMEKTRSYYTTNGASGWTEFGGSLLTTLYTGDRSSLILAPYSMLLGSNEGKGVFRYDFESLPDVPDTVDQIVYPPLTNQVNTTKGQDKHIHIYPNPASERVKIKANNPVRKILMINMQGQIMKEIHPGKSTIMLNIEDAKPGMYLFQVWNDKNILTTRKIFIQ